MTTDEWKKTKEIFISAIDLPERERTFFLSKCETNLREKVQKLIESYESSNNFIVESAFVDIGLADENDTDFYIGKQIDDYKILEEIGHGGMGTVYLANSADESFDKKVAIKLIKRGMDTNVVLKRFMMERKILAQLENPNIASLLDGGSTTDGLPYFVMEYIEGEPITKFCDLHKFSVEERLALFRKVCSAVSYAHQNLVVHRDIKPSNILVTTAGTPKLLDFGIAKLLHPDWSLETNEATATMFRLMTPEYASPEQIRGLPITTASDVYSLGVVLYELLSGERPYRIESRLPQEFAQIVLTEEPLRPSSVVNKTKKVILNQTNPKSETRNLKSLRGDLDNIILKALRKEPERRYQSVQEFSEDIRRHLVGLPVLATADTSFYRIGKFVKRHRAGVFAGVLMLFTILLATTITTWQAIIARREQAKTQQRFNQVRKLANTVLFDHYERVKNLPGATSLREKMVKDALEYLDNLSAESIDDKDLQRELVAAYRKLGEIQGKTSDGGNLGEENAARQNYLKALVIQEKLSADDSNIEDQRSLGNLYLNVGELFEKENERPLQSEYTEKGLRIFQTLENKNPNQTQSQADLARALWHWANIVRLKGDNDGSIQTYAQAAEIYEMLGGGNENPSRYQRNAALTYKNIGSIYFVKKDFQKSLEFYRKAFLFDRENAVREPENIETQMDLSFSYKSIGLAFYQLKETAKSLEEITSAIAVQEKVFAADAQNKFAANALFGSYTNIAEIYQESGDFLKAEMYYRKCGKMLETDLNKQESARWKIGKAKYFWSFGNFLLKRFESGNRKISSDLKNAQENLLEAKNIYQILQNQNILDPAYRENIEQINASLEKLNLALGKN